MSISNRSLKTFVSDARLIVETGKPALVEATLLEALERLEAMQLDLGEQLVINEDHRLRQPGAWAV